MRYTPYSRPQAGGAGGAAGRARTVTIITAGDSHAKRLVRAAGPPPSNVLRATVHFESVRAEPGVGGAKSSEAETVMESIFHHRFGTPAHAPPDMLVLSLGGNMFTSRVSPNVVLPGHNTIAENAVKDIRWLLGGLTAYAARGSTVLLLSPIPRARLSGVGLSAFRQLSSMLTLARKRCFATFAHAGGVGATPPGV